MQQVTQYQPFNLHSRQQLQQQMQLQQERCYQTIMIKSLEE